MAVMLLMHEQEQSTTTATEGVLKRAALWQQRPTLLNFSHAENNHYTKMRSERKCVSTIESWVVLKWI